MAAGGPTPRRLVRGGRGARQRRNLATGFGVLALLGATVLVLVASAQRARRLARQQLEFVTGVTHELNTPLAAIRSAGQNLAAGIVTDAAQVRRYGDLIEKEGAALDGARRPGPRLRGHRVAESPLHDGAARGRDARRRGAAGPRARAPAGGAHARARRDAAAAGGAGRRDGAQARALQPDRERRQVRGRGRLARGARLGARRRAGGRAARRGPRARDRARGAGAGVRALLPRAGGGAEPRPRQRPRAEPGCGAWCARTAAACAPRPREGGGASLVVELPAAPAEEPAA